MLRRITPLGQRFLTRKATLPSATSALSRRTLASDTAVTSNDQQQAPNRMDTWSENQADRATAMSGPRFEQTDMSAQPRPMSAMELIAEVPVQMVEKRIATCDGGGGPLGHPKVFINLDEGKPVPCHYCGIRFQQANHHH
ncbi:MAG: zinc-finger domain-containing protein [Piptocephalis tieghemiana]|nr:MAG: zinc-finger domain-containing protein [Piptocephalis tieghemiana]